MYAGELAIQMDNELGTDKNTFVVVVVVIVAVRFMLNKLCSSDRRSRNWATRRVRTICARVAMSLNIIDFMTPSLPLSSTPLFLALPCAREKHTRKYVYKQPLQARNAGP